MVVSPVKVLGFLAAFLTTSAFVPQVWTSWRTRDTRGISLGMFSTMTVGVLLWLIYGVLIGDAPLVAANGLAFVLSLAVLILKIRHG